MTSSLCVPLPGEAGSERMTGCNPESRGRSHAFHPRRWRRTRSRTRTSPSSSGESERTEGRAAKALRRASRAALMWPEEAGRLRDADRPFTELRAVGPFTARFISNWLREGTSVGERPPLRDGFLSYAQAREVVASHADWRTGLEGDLQMHTDETDGAASVEDMVAAAGALGHHYVAITDHSRTLRITNGMDETRLAAQGARIDAVNATGTPTWALRAIEMDLTPDGARDRRLPGPSGSRRRPAPGRRRVGWLGLHRHGRPHAERAGLLRDRDRGRHPRGPAARAHPELPSAHAAAGVGWSCSCTEA